MSLELQGSFAGPTLHFSQCDKLASRDWNSSTMRKRVALQENPRLRVGLGMTATDLPVREKGASGWQAERSVRL